MPLVCQNDQCWSTTSCVQRMYFLTTNHTVYGFHSICVNLNLQTHILRIMNHSYSQLIKQETKWHTCYVSVTADLKIFNVINNNINS